MSIISGSLQRLVRLRAEMILPTMSEDNDAISCLKCVIYLFTATDPENKMHRCDYLKGHGDVIDIHAMAYQTVVLFRLNTIERLVRLIACVV